MVNNNNFLNHMLVDINENVIVILFKMLIMLILLFYF